ncbi:Toluene-4-sulfonate monooxygenase system iron-sulfur subunit TsaM1 [Acaryochloris thomasi RCC1774]|uniref:Toluene-4-sulfonate monooxygenase system iron-sulfur subunit TsaM1 n=1 Tax=Acaryochloris thomasi RCC1774 TaxID=1764569 RepID=A0A2W1K2S5_9CYAN|nr:aromatic ring-hydroxylating dioxygenase subunit alpha [Acaryochloris thomasi]PZD74601.1 Toluene-4-sulfonate monooxygenase system iron-sulfur subunit TsaM1 [Acaryochloris thomasi RCC1774]
MELATTLQGQTVQNRVREVGINPDHWYPVAWADQLQPGTVQPVQIWQQAIALYRDQQGNLNALEDACPHKGIALHQGKVEGPHLACPYHGWQFNSEGECVHIPYFPPEQKLPCAKARSYPVQEQYGIVWVFPGNRDLADQTTLPEVPEYGNPEFFMVRIPGHFQAHFSICNENTMDVFHGYLHQELQGWFDPVLLSLKQTENTVKADYQVSYAGIMTKFLGLSKENEGVTTRVVSVHYRYPHYHSTMEGVSSLHLMRSPVGPTETRSFSLMFLKLPIPSWLLRRASQLGLEKLILDKLFMKFLLQDVEMMESEQRTYSANPDRQYVEVNPAILALQRVIVGQYVKFMQQSRESDSQNNGNQITPLPVADRVAAK